jgi:hypothetical protein
VKPVAEGTDIVRDQSQIFGDERQFAQFPRHRREDGFEMSRVMDVRENYRWGCKHVCRK